MGGKKLVSFFLIAVVVGVPGLLGAAEPLRRARSSGSTGGNANGNGGSGAGGGPIYGGRSLTDTSGNGGGSSIGGGGAAINGGGALLGGGDEGSGGARPGGGGGGGGGGGSSPTGGGERATKSNDDGPDKPDGPLCKVRVPVEKCEQTKDDPPRTVCQTVQEEKDIPCDQVKNAEQCAKGLKGLRCRQEQTAKACKESPDTTKGCVQQCERLSGFGPAAQQKKAECLAEREDYCKAHPGSPDCKVQGSRKVSEEEHAQILEGLKKRIDVFAAVHKREIDAKDNFLKLSGKYSVFATPRAFFLAQSEYHAKVEIGVNDFRNSLVSSQKCVQDAPKKKGRLGGGGKGGAGNQDETSAGGGKANNAKKKAKEIYYVLSNDCFDESKLREDGGKIKEQIKYSMDEIDRRRAELSDPLSPCGPASAGSGGAQGSGGGGIQGGGVQGGQGNAQATNSSINAGGLCKDNINADLDGSRKELDKTHVMIN